MSVCLSVRHLLPMLPTRVGKETVRDETMRVETVRVETMRVETMRVGVRTVKVTAGGVRGVCVCVGGEGVQ